MADEAARLFDLSLARRLLALDHAALLAWLRAELPALKATTRRGAAALLAVLRRTLPPAEAAALPPVEAFLGHWDDLALALAGAADEAEVALARAALAEKAAFGEERVELLVPGGPAAVFGAARPAGALCDRDLFAGEGPERYLLLQAAEVERLAEALRAGAAGAEAGAGGEAGQAARSAARLLELAARCRAEPGLRVAWLLAR
ncbi:MAG: hypothetical protein IPO09_01280 [Anaeromyxobacter sp.]|nr:hypothetical protein [Anaeromyxobacter sp.]MBL0278207.1 hypothetical protein [Anaeromyxobacter sp.]